MLDPSRPPHSVDAVKRWYADKLESYFGAVALFLILELVIYAVDQWHWRGRRVARDRPVLLVP
jgi:hypothetical protein